MNRLLLSIITTTVLQGLEGEDTYPYTAEDGECAYDATQTIGAAAGFIDIPEGEEDLLTMALAINGPISVAIDASQNSFQFYSKGRVYTQHQSQHSILIT